MYLVDAEELTFMIFISFVRFTGGCVLHKVRARTARGASCTDPDVNALKRIPLLLAWLVVLAASGLIVLEESGLLVEVLRTRLAARLGPLGEGVSIDHVALRWLEPGVVVEGVTLRAATDTPEEEGDVLLQIRSAHLSLAFDRTQPLARLHIDGGRIRIGDRLIEGFDHVFANLPEGEPGEGRELTAPPFVVTDFVADLEMPDGALFELGQASLAAQPSPIGGYQLYGRIIPTLSTRLVPSRASR